MHSHFCLVRYHTQSHSDIISSDYLSLDLLIFFSSQGDFECCEADDDDLVPDSEIVFKGSSHVPSPGVASPPLDPKIQNLARQMQQAGDALYQQYEGRVEVIPIVCQFLCD